MIVLSDEVDRFVDSADPALRYRIPVGLEPVRGTDDVPDAMLARHANGGLLTLRLALRWPALSVHERPVPVSAARFRILLRTPGSTDAGKWHESPLATEAIVDRRVTLDALESALVARLARSGDAMLDIELEFAVRGRSPTLPWRIRADGALLRAQLQALLPPAPVQREDIDRAFQGLRVEDFEWFPREPNALPPRADLALQLCAYHALPLFFSSSPEGFTLEAQSPAHLDLDFDLPRPASRWFGLGWSFSAFLTAQSDPDRHFFELTVPAPLEAAQLLVTHDLPLTDEGIRRLEVEVRTGGPSGELNHRFDIGRPSAARLRFVRRTFEELELEISVRATVVRPDGTTTIVSRNWVGRELVVRITAASLGLRPVAVSAEPLVFEHAEKIELTVGSRHITLTSEHSLQWAIRSSAPGPAAAVAVLPSGERVALGTVAPTGDAFVVTGATIGVDTVSELLFEWVPSQAAYLAVRTDSGPWRTLEPGRTRYGLVHRVDRLQSASVRFRTRHVGRNADGATLPMVESDWQTSTGLIVTVNV